MCQTETLIPAHLQSMSNVLALKCQENSLSKAEDVLDHR